jgi:ABC-2 type transport system ATP-binding protein
VSAEAGVELRSLTRRFGRTVAVDDVTFDVRRGEVLGLLGPNGAGKTTTMRMLTGYLRPTSGQVVVGGVDLAEDPVGAHAQLGYMPESAPVPVEMTVWSFLRYCARLRRVPRPRQRSAVGRVIGQCGLQRVRSARIGSLSKGFRQRVSLAQALVHDPPVLVLDEPTAGLDPRQVVETRELIGRLGRSRTVLLSSHLLSEVEQLCPRVVVLDRGRVVAVDEVDALTGRTGASTLEEAYLRLVRD